MTKQTIDTYQKQLAKDRVCDREGTSAYAYIETNDIKQSGLEAACRRWTLACRVTSWH